MHTLQAVSAHILPSGNTDKDQEETCIQKKSLEGKGVLIIKTKCGIVLWLDAVFPDVSRIQLQVQITTG